MRFTEKLRMYWDDLFYPALVDRLETDLLNLRSDLQQLRLDKDRVIAELRNDKAVLTSKLAIFELSIQQRAGIDPSRMAAKKPSFASFTSPPVMTRWEQYRQEYEAALAKDDVDEMKAQAIAAAKLAEKDAQEAVPTVA